MGLKKESILQPPSDKRIGEFESFHKVKLPEDYISFIKSSNGAVQNELTIKVDDQDRLV